MLTLLQIVNFSTSVSLEIPLLVEIIRHAYFPWKSLSKIELVGIIHYAYFRWRSLSKIELVAILKLADVCINKVVRSSQNQSTG